MLCWSLDGAEDKRRDKRGEELPVATRIRRKIGSAFKVLDVAEAKPLLFLVWSRNPMRLATACRYLSSEFLKFLFFLRAIALCLGGGAAGNIRRSRLVRRAVQY